MTGGCTGTGSATIRGAAGAVFAFGFFAGGALTAPVAGDFGACWDACWDVGDLPAGWTAAVFAFALAVLGAALAGLAVLTGSGSPPPLLSARPLAGAFATLLLDGLLIDFTGGWGATFGDDLAGALFGLAGFGVFAGLSALPLCLPVPRCFSRSFLGEAIVWGCFRAESWAIGAVSRALRGPPLVTLPPALFSELLGGADLVGAALTVRVAAFDLSFELLPTGSFINDSSNHSEQSGNAGIVW